MDKRNAPGSSVHGMWEFPGGKVEPFETLHCAARREIREENGLLIAVAGVIVTGEPTLTDSHLELRWFTAAEMEAAPETMIANSLEFLRMRQMQKRIEAHAVRNGK